MLTSATDKRMRSSVKPGYPRLNLCSKGGQHTQNQCKVTNKHVSLPERVLVL